MLLPGFRWLLVTLGIPRMEDSRSSAWFHLAMPNFPLPTRTVANGPGSSPFPRDLVVM